MTLMHMSLLFLTNSNSMMVKRVLYPGESWVYYKIYCSPRTADKLLSGPVKDLVEQLKEKDLIKKWFFIRYQDPDYHIRLRLERSSKSDLDAIFHHVNHGLAYYLDHQLIYKIQLDTYIREIERYGEHTIEFCEEIFHLDSELALAITALGLSDQQLLAYTLDQMKYYVESFALPDDQAKQFYKDRRNDFYEEFGIKGKQKVAFRRKYEKDREGIEQFVIAQLPCYQLIQKERSSIKELIIDILHVLTLKEPNKESLLASIIHMSINRIYRDEQRVFEMLCYDYLNRL